MRACEVTPAPWPALLSDLDALRDRYLAAFASSAERGQGGDVTEAGASTLEMLSDVARAATTRLEARALMRSALDGPLQRARVAGEAGRNDEGNLIVSSGTGDDRDRGAPLFVRLGGCGEGRRPSKASPCDGDGAMARSRAS